MKRSKSPISDITDELDKLESFHRSMLVMLNAEFGCHHQYFKDVIVEPPIYPLVRLLNNRWTVTSSSCGGHWPPEDRSLVYPFVLFFVLPGYEDIWQRVTDRIRPSLSDASSRQATIDIMEGRQISDAKSRWFNWHFIRKEAQGKSISKIRVIIESGEIQDLIELTCYELSHAIPQIQKEQSEQPTVNRK